MTGEAVGILVKLGEMKLRMWAREGEGEDGKYYRVSRKIGILVFFLSQITLWHASPWVHLLQFL